MNKLQEIAKHRGNEFNASMDKLCIEFLVINREYFPQGMNMDSKYRQHIGAWHKNLNPHYDDYYFNIQNNIRQRSQRQWSIIEAYLNRFQYRFLKI
jgi:hypothetical protein